MKTKKKQKRKRCENCHKLFPVDEMIYGPDPFGEEINNNKTPVWLCCKCHNDSVMDI